MSASTPEHLRPTHARLFNAFRNMSKQFFKFASVDSRPLLKPDTIKRSAPRWPLAHYGIQAKLPTLPIQLALGGEVAIQLHAAICAYSARVPNASQIPVRLRSARFKPPRFAPWEHLVFRSLPLQGIANRHILTGTSQSKQHYHSNMKGAARSLWLSCPKCAAIRDVRNLTLQHDTKTMAIRCKTCKQTCTSHKWLCPCMKAWSECPACRPIGFACSAPIRIIKRDNHVNSIASDVPDWVPRASKRVKRVPPLPPIIALGITMLTLLVPLLLCLLLLLPLPPRSIRGRGPLGVHSLAPREGCCSCQAQPWLASSQDLLCLTAKGASEAWGVQALRAIAPLLACLLQGIRSKDAPACFKKGLIRPL